MIGFVLTAKQPHELYTFYTPYFDLQWLHLPEPNSTSKDTKEVHTKLLGEIKNLF